MQVARRLWAAISHLGTVIWLWSLGGGLVTSLATAIVTSFLEVDGLTQGLAVASSGVLSTAAVASYLRHRWGPPEHLSEPTRQQPVPETRRPSGIERFGAASIIEDLHGLAERATVLASEASQVRGRPSDDFVGKVEDWQADIRRILAGLTYQQRVVGAALDPSWSSASIASQRRALVETIRDLGQTHNVYTADVTGTAVTPTASKPDVVAAWTKLSDQPGGPGVRLGAVAREESGRGAVDVELLVVLVDGTERRDRWPLLEGDAQIVIDLGPLPPSAQRWSDPLSHALVRFSDRARSERWERRYDWPAAEEGRAVLRYEHPISQ